MYEGAQVRASEAVAFNVMTGEVITSRGCGCGRITLWNRVAKKFGDRTLKDNEKGWCEYEVNRNGNVYVLPEGTAEAALPVVERKQEERSPEFYSLADSVFSHRCLRGRNFYGNPPYEDLFIERLLTKILIMDFLKNPTNTKFLLVVPYKPSAGWWKLTTKFEEQG
ncbi:hypothetical protein CYMTET_19094 [Cymbomonas tetramitiformis]|uniref:Uncharacterized protein n=1 Tax=Cymbomonas tetramitiformis TaxID=36881 RepID=A0AAE0G7A4_9CHLO|nr:hypothetical protein CYMTET_19094 [Cymbomonas tetramitiformis]